MSRTIVADIWVAFFQECQRYRCGQEAPDYGGETLWLSGYHALSLLDAETRALAERMAVHYGVETGEVREAAEAAGVLHGAELEHFRRFGDRMMPDGTRITNVPPEIVQAGVSPTHTNPLVKAHPETGRKALWVSPRFVHHLEDTATGEHWSVESSWAFISELLRKSLADPDNVYGHVFERGDVVVWDELAGTLHTTTVYEPPYMEGPRLLRKLPPGDGGGHWHARRKRRAAAANRHSR